MLGHFCPMWLYFGVMMFCGEHAALVVIDPDSMRSVTSWGNLEGESWLVGSETKTMI